jgi:hypothetical protein
MGSFTFGAVIAATLAIALPTAAQSLGTPQSGTADPILRITPVDRGRSQPLAPSPSVKGEPGYKIILMHHRLEHGQPIIELRVPVEYVGGQGAEVVPNIGFFFLATYPNMKGSFASDNRGLVQCIGYCHGRMTIGIENRSGDEPSPGGFLNSITNYKKCATRNVNQSGGFSEITSCDISGPQAFQAHEDYYVQRSNNGLVERFAICRPNTPNPTCEEWMRLGRYPSVEVHYTFGMRDLTNWVAVRTSVDQLVSGFVVRD